MSTIAAKMNQALKKIDAVTKEGKNQAQGYNYVKAADVANEVRKAMAEVGIAFQYDVVDYDRWEQAREGKAPMQWCSIKVEGTFHDTESDQKLTSTALGWGSDAGDKAPYKAMTGALKYLLRHTFIIPDESDPENDSAEEKQEKIESSVKRQQAAPSDKDEMEWSFNQKTGVLICRVIDAKEKVSTGKDKRPFYAVKVNGMLADKRDMMFCWHKSMFPHLAKSVGKICKFMVSSDAKGFWSLDTVIEIGGEKVQEEENLFDGQAWGSIVASAKDVEDLNALLMRADADVKKVEVVTAEAKKRGYAFDDITWTYRDPEAPSY